MRLWTPAATTTALWLDATDSATITLVSSAVSQWADKSGNSRHATQNTAGNRPVVNATGIDSQPAIDFATSTKFLSVTRGFITNSVSAFVVWSGGSSNQRLVDQRSNGTFGTIKGWYLKNQNSGADIGGADNGAGGYRSRNVTFTPSGAQLSVLVFPVSDNAEFYLNGTDTGTNNNSGSLPTNIDNTGVNIVIGGNANGSSTQDFTGLIGEVILLSSAATTTQRQLIEGYLAHKWGLEANLPITHPYRYSPPISPPLIQPVAQPHPFNTIARLGL